MEELERQELPAEEAQMTEPLPEEETPRMEEPEQPAEEPERQEEAAEQVTEEIQEAAAEEVPAELAEFDLEDIMKEFGGESAGAEVAEEERAQEAEAALGGDTIRLDTTAFTQGKVRNAAPIEDEPEEEAKAASSEPEQAEPFSEQWEPEYEQPMGEYIPPQPIIFRPKSRIRELKRKLVAGPEKRYYKLAEIGFGKLQLAIFLSLLVVLASAASTVMFALGMVPENRLRLMIFGQCLAMLISALLGSFQMVEGVTDLFKKGFTLNTMLVVTFIVCCVDGVFCLQQLRVPCCAAFSVQVTMSLWSAYQRRSAEMGQMDTMRKAARLDSLHVVKDFHEGEKGLLRSEGDVEDFMDHYDTMARPERILNWYCLGALVVAAGVAITAGVFYGVYAALQVAAVSLMAAVPATAFVAYSRPYAVLERRLHDVGTVLCGWRGVLGLCGKAVFPIGFYDLFPAGTTKIHGVKFFGSRRPEQIIAYGTAMIVSSGSGLAPVFTQVLDSRNGRHYEAANMRAYDNGGIGGEVQGESVLVGSLQFLKEMGVEVPEGIQVNQAICVAIDGELCGLFAVTYDKVRSSSAGLKTLCGCGRLKLIVTAGDSMLDNNFIRSQFGVKTKRILFPAYAERLELQKKNPDEENPVLLLTTREGLVPFAYGVAGARILRKSVTAGLVISILGSVVGLGIMLTLTLLGRLDLLSPVHMFAYQLLWLGPGFLATTWTKSI